MANQLNRDELALGVVVLLVILVAYLAATVGR